MFKYLALLATLALTQAAPLGGNYPNGTDKASHWWANPSGTFQIYNIEVTDNAGFWHYPVHFAQPLTAHVIVNNNGSTIRHIREDISLAKWDFVEQKWITLPTFGLLNGLDACRSSVACPIPQGNQMLNVTVDFSNTPSIVNQLKNDVPYQLQVTLTNLAINDKIVFTVQAKAGIQ